MVDAKKSKRVRVHFHSSASQIQKYDVVMHFHQKLAELKNPVQGDRGKDKEIKEYRWSVEELLTRDKL